jgi:ABC-type ATPase with predicted acetyltransferase domain
MPKLSSIFLMAFAGAAAATAMARLRKQQGHAKILQNRDTYRPDNDEDRVPVDTSPALRPGGTTRP